MLGLLCIWEINCKLSICCRHWETCGIPEDMTDYWLCLYALCRNWECCVPQWLIKYSECPWSFLLSSSGILSWDFWSFDTNHKFVTFLKVFCVSQCSTRDKNVLWTLLSKKRNMFACGRGWPGRMLPGIHSLAVCDTGLS